MYDCVSCGKSFSRKNNLFRHVQTHRGISYLCDICARVFPRKDTLTRHLRTVHGVYNARAHQIKTVPRAETTVRDAQDSQDDQVITNHRIPTGGRISYILGSTSEPNKCVSSTVRTFPIASPGQKPNSVELRLHVVRHMDETGNAVVIEVDVETQSQVEVEMELELEIDESSYARGHVHVEQEDSERTKSSYSKQLY